MGILNITPDSFYDGGKWLKIDKALKHTEKMITDGASIIDIGGESTRPGYQKVSKQEEIERVLPAIEAIKKRFDIPLSIDTYKSEVAEEALKVGVDLINDVSGFKYDKNMAKVVSKYDATCCLVHNNVLECGDDGLDKMNAEIFEIVNMAKLAGISEEKIIIDPGIGFGKTKEMNLKILKEISKICNLKYPVLIGSSRKSVISKVLGVSADKCLEGTLVTTAISVIGGCSFIRVHDVKENFMAIKMAMAIKG